MQVLLVLSVNIGTIALIYQSLSLIMAEPIRGQNILPADIPFIASIAIKHFNDTTERVHFCTGSLIAKNLVLTAAHCLRDVEYKQVDVVIGSADLRDAQPKYAIKSWKTFEKWAANKYPRWIRLQGNDIAIIKLKRQVRQAGVTPANITKLKIEELYGKNATTIGWTAELLPNSTVSRFLKKANVQILTMSECQRRFQLITNLQVHIPKGTMCAAASPFVLVTDGDSGGPLLDENNNILGITRGICPLLDNSYNCSEGFADEHRINVYTDFIPEYRHFIEDSKICF